MHSTVLAVFLCAFLVVSYCDELVTGGKSDIDSLDPIVQQMARYAVSEMGSEYGYISTLKAQTQVVKGLMYHLSLLVNHIKTGEDAVKQLECDVKVLSQNWLGVIKLTSFKCKGAE